MGICLKKHLNVVDRYAFGWGYPIPLEGNHLACLRVLMTAGLGLIKALRINIDDDPLFGSMADGGKPLRNRHL